MGVSARAAYDVAAHAKHLARAAMTACTGQGIEPCGLAVRVARSGRTRPSRRMGIPVLGVLSRNAETRVTVDAEELAVADEALRRARRGLLIVHGNEIRSVHGVAKRLVEVQSRRDRRHRDAVASGALTLRVTGRA
jgi:hypothetical protein